MITDIFTVAIKEMREFPYFRKDRSRTNIISLLLFLGIFGIFLPLESGPSWVTSPISILPWAWMPFMLTGTTMVDCFAGERERHTLETLLASRLSDTSILFGKILAGIIYGTLITFLCILVGLTTVNLAPGHSGILIYPLSIAIVIITAVLLISTLASGLGVLVSLRATSVKQAQQTFTIAYLALFVPVFILPLLPPTILITIDTYLSQLSIRTIAEGIGVGIFFLNVLLILLAKARFKRTRLILE